MTLVPRRLEPTTSTPHLLRLRVPPNQETPPPHEDSVVASLSRMPVRLSSFRPSIHGRDRPKRKNRCAACHHARRNAARANQPWQTRSRSLLLELFRLRPGHRSCRWKPGAAREFHPFAQTHRGCDDADRIGGARQFARAESSIRADFRLAAPRGRSQCRCARALAADL